MRGFDAGHGDSVGDLRDGRGFVQFRDWGSRGFGQWVVMDQWLRHGLFGDGDWAI
jgi:hypothetical protein